MKQCPTCKNEVSYNAETCPKCGHVLKRKNSNPALSAFIIFVIIVFIWEYLSKLFR